MIKYIIHSFCNIVSVWNGCLETWPILNYTHETMPTNPLKRGSRTIRIVVMLFQLMIQNHLNCWMSLIKQNVAYRPQVLAHLHFHRRNGYGIIYQESCTTALKLHTTLHKIRFVSVSMFSIHVSVQAWGKPFNTDSWFF